MTICPSFARHTESPVEIIFGLRMETTMISLNDILSALKWVYEIKVGLGFLT